MDSDLIYTKTASGEEAMYQRTRVMQRNVRMILILVDGQSTVADLCVKTGNRQLTESALTDLEKGGFIELRVEQDSIWAESKKVAQEIRAAAIDKALQFSRNKDAPRSSSSQTVEQSISIHSVPNSVPRGASSGYPPSQFSLSPGVHKRLSGESIPSGFSQPQVAKNKSSSGAREQQARPPWLERVKALLDRPERPKSKTPVKVIIRRRPGKSVGWPVIMMYAVVGVVVAGFLAINFFPFERYLPDVESVLSQISGRSVKIGAMRVEVYPKPGLFLSAVRAGSEKDQIRISEIRLQPDIFSFTESKKIFSDAVLSGVSLSPDLVSGLPGVFAAMSKADSKIAVKRVRLENVEVSFASLSLPEMEGEVRLSTAGLFQSLALRLPDRTVNLDVKPQAQKLDVVLEGIAWRPSQASPVLIDSFNLKGNIDVGTFTISELELHTFDGVIKAHGIAVQHAEKMLSLSGDLSFERINATRLGEALGIGPQFSGETMGKLSFSTIADSGPSIFSAISGDGDFTMRHGGVREIDLVETVRRASSTPVLGGSTSFEQLTGKIKLTPTASVFSGLVLSSGLMQAAGSLEVSKDLGVRGRMDLQMRGSVNQSRVPITIKGPLKAPSLQLGNIK